MVPQHLQVPVLSLAVRDLPPEDKVKNRRFGVELEFGLPNDYDDWDRFEAALSKQVKAGKFGKTWLDTLHEDGSLIEIDSPILQGPRGFDELRRMMAFVKKFGGFVDQEDGMHVHHDAPEFINDTGLVLQLVKSWKQNQRLIHSFVDRERARWSADSSIWNGGPCPAWTSDAIRSLDFDYHRGEDPDITFGKHRRCDLNIASLSTHGTIEIRLHEGCLDYPRAEAWVRFGQSFINKISNEQKMLDEIPSHEELLRKLRTYPKARPVLLARVESQEERV